MRDVAKIASLAVLLVVIDTMLLVTRPAASGRVPLWSAVLAGIVVGQAVGGAAW